MSRYKGVVVEMKRRSIQAINVREGIENNHYYGLNQ